MYALCLKSQLFHFILKILLQYFRNFVHPAHYFCTQTFKRTNMKKLMLLVAGALLVGPAVKAQTIDEIVSKHNEAMGGVDAWKKVSSIKYVGSMNAGGQEIGVTLSTVAGKGMRQDIEVMGMKGFSIVTPTAGWSFFPFGNGQTKPEPMTADDVKQSQDELDVMDELMTYKTKGAKVELVGKDDVDGTECFKLKYTDKDNQVTTMYIDPSTYYTIREVKKVKANGQEMDMTTTLGNFQKLPEGIVVPMNISTPNGDVKITKVEVNSIQDESIFNPEAGKG
jgi:hypothetical protein